MALNLVNNSYNGDLIGQLATLLTFGATDLSFLHTIATKGKIVKFPYASVDTVVQVFDSICNVSDAGNRNREIVEISLIKFVVQFTACYDEEFDTDYGDASGGYETQSLGEQIGEWSRMHIDNFSDTLQNVRWSGDTTSADADLSRHDGYVELITDMGAFDASTNPTGYHQVTTTTVTASNAAQQIAIVHDAVPNLKVRQHKGFKVLVAGNVASLLITQSRDKALQVGLPSMVKVSLNAETGQLTDGSFFGSPVFVAYGLDATAANSNVIMAGIFTGDRYGVLKYAVNHISGKKGVETLTLKEVNDGDAVRFRSVKTQNVGIIPNLSQMAMNL